MIVRNTGVGLLVLPRTFGRVQIAPGAEVEIDPKAAEVPGVAAWVFAGLLEVVDAGSPEPAGIDGREGVVMGIIAGLPQDAEHFTDAGVPDVRKINALLPEGMAPLKAAERDEIWSKMNGE